MEGLTYESPFQQASFSGTRTALIPCCFMTRIDATVLGPSKIPAPCAHMNSVPERSTPRSTTRSPVALTSLLPETCSCSCGAELEELGDDGVVATRCDRSSVLLATKTADDR